MIYVLEIDGRFIRCRDAHQAERLAGLAH